ncbi:MAG: pyrroloquinoline quinone biosynthesis protein PqqE [Ktedonobacteraceae bacterium]|nr:pyrroloquinoline quinone biosynthesis protein PqqE [Ktedonobacteraceae bacterium]
MNKASNRPLGLLAELTYRCPLHCPYCSNPLNLSSYSDELTLDEWVRVFTEARTLGVLQLHLSGGEPLQRRDIVEIVDQAHALGFYTNLITSALALTAAKAEQLKKVGLDHVQISLQAANAETSDMIAGTPSFQKKVRAARLVKALGFPLTLNVVLHRRNIEQIGPILALAEELAADRIELANTQYYGWALHNRAALLPTREQLQQAELVVRAERERLAGQMQILYVLPDYYSRYPKPCMGGWARHQLTVTPNGNVLPCSAAAQIPSLPIENIRLRSLEEIWDESPMFTRFRGTDWMPEPCRNCPRKNVDFGGCRCQAFQLTGDAAATDPVCHLSPHHALVEDVVESVNSATPPAIPELVYRSFDLPTT